MFIQLTRTDGVPVWLNACFIVTVEPGRGSGSIVVPIGDGLDYEVRESPETVLSMLEGAPPAKIVPVPPPKSLTPRPDDVSPEVHPLECDRIKSPDADSKRQKKVRKTKSAVVKNDAEVEKPAESEDSVQKDAAVKAAPKKKRVSSKKKAEPAVPAEPVLPEAYQKIVDDLKSRKCRTVKRMRNAMKSFYGKTDSEEIDGIIEAMIATGCILIESDGHVNWIA